MILILKTGKSKEHITSRCGDSEDWIVNKMELTPEEYFVHFTSDFENIPPPKNYTGIVITGSSLMVTDLKLTKANLCKWLLNQQRLKVPIIGICFGHQLLTVINGGVVKNNTIGRQIGLHKTHLTKSGEKDELFADLPCRFNVLKIHSQSVAMVSKSASILSSNNSNIIDAIKFAPKCWGVQFHPEFSVAIMNLFIDEINSRLTNEEPLIEPLLIKDEAIDFGELLLKRFKAIINMHY